MNINFAGWYIFLKTTKAGKSILLGVGIAFLLIIGFIFFPNKHQHNDSSVTAPKSATKATTHIFSNDIEPIDAQIEKPTVPKTNQQNLLSSYVSGTTSPPPCPMRLYAAGPNEEASISGAYLPYGRLIKCTLINTVDSSRIATPIIGMVLEDVWQEGQCIIPAGTEVHGTAQIDRSRERIASEKEWIIIWQDGKEMPIKGIALSNSQHGERWGITDGSAGLEGEIIKSDSLAQLKEILASTISAAGSGLVPMTTTTSPFGNTQVATTGSAEAVLGESVQAAGRVYAQQIMQSIQRDGWFVRCKAGSTFYLYTMQTIDLANAHIGSSENLKEKK